MKYEQALKIAERVKSELEPHCWRIEIAGSIRRKKPEVGDIEIVAIPKAYDVGLFASGIALIVSQWPKVRGELPCKHTRRVLPEGIELDLFFATRENWGLILAIRTGSAEFSHYKLACGWSRRGFVSKGGRLYNSRGDAVITAEEVDVFRAAGVAWHEPEAREGERYWDSQHQGYFPKPRRLADGVSCGEPGCISQFSRPCEGCGRIGARNREVES